MKYIFQFLLLTCLGLNSVHAQESTAQPKEVFTSTAEMRAKVKDIDHKTRKLTLEGDGRTVTLTADPSIKNLDKVKKGDTVVVGYAESLVYQIGKGNKAQAPVATDVVASSRPGTAPAKLAGRQIDATVLISQIDKKKNTVTFKNAQGEQQTFKVQRPERLEGLKVGDTVDITYTEAFAVKLEKQETKVQ